MAVQPPLDTFGLGIRSDGSIWRYQPTAPGGMVELWDGTKGTPQLGPENDMTQGAGIRVGRTPVETPVHAILGVGLQRHPSQQAIRQR